jgi:hypothetical protein
LEAAQAAVAERVHRQEVAARTAVLDSLQAYRLIPVGESTTLLTAIFFNEPWRFDMHIRGAVHDQKGLRDCAPEGIYSQTP